MRGLRECAWDRLEGGERGEQCCNLRSTKNIQIAVPSLLFSSISSVLYSMSFGFHHRAPKGSLVDCKALWIIQRHVLVSIYLFPEIQRCHCKQYLFQDSHLCPLCISSALTNSCLLTVIFQMFSSGLLYFFALSPLFHVRKCSLR